MGNPVLLTVSGSIPADIELQIQRGERPQADYLAMQRRFQADLLDYQAARRRGGRFGAVGALDVSGGELLAWLGPAMGPDVFEVGDEGRAAFITHDPTAPSAFRPYANGKFLADIYLLARQRLAGLGVTAVYGGGLCTVADRQRFYSYRRDGATGRVASLVWLAGA